MADGPWPMCLCVGKRREIASGEACGARGPGSRSLAAARAHTKKNKRDIFPSLSAIAIRNSTMHQPISTVIMMRDIHDHFKGFSLVRSIFFFLSAKKRRVSFKSTVTHFLLIHMAIYINIFARAIRAYIQCMDMGRGEMMNYDDYGI